MKVGFFCNKKQILSQRIFRYLLEENGTRWAFFANFDMFVSFLAVLD